MKVRCIKFAGNRDLFKRLPYTVGAKYSMCPSIASFSENAWVIRDNVGCEFFVSLLTSPDNPEQKFFVVGFGDAEFTFEKVE